MKINGMCLVQSENHDDFMGKLYDTVQRMEESGEVTVEYRVNPFTRHSEFGGKIEDGVLYTALVTSKSEWVQDEPVNAVKSKS